jgi:hypothetical protein
MDAKDYIQRQLTSVNMQSDATTGDLEAAHLAKTSPGTCNALGAIYVHAVASEDWFVHGLIGGKPTLWDSEGWGAKLGLHKVPVGEDWGEANAATCDLNTIRAYEQAARQATAAYVAALDDRELNRVVQSPFGAQPVAGLLAFMAVHTAGHMGEIAALKGAQGLKGLPY